MKTIKERFDDKIELIPFTTCWFWNGATDRKRGYGYFESKPAYRIAYELYIGIVPHGKICRHTCNNILCVNPYHIRIVIEKKKANLKEYYKNHKCTFPSRISQWKRNATIRNIEWELTDRQLKTMPFVCHYTGIELTLEPNKINTISLDRLDSLKGYTKDNVVFCCADINMMKQQFSKQHFIDLCKKITVHNTVLIFQ